MDINGIVWSIDTKSNENVEKAYDIKNICCDTHKKYNVLSNQMYVPICVGGYKTKDF